MLSYTNFQNFALFILRVIIAAVFFVAGYYKFPMWNHPHPEMTSADLIIIKILSIAEPLGALGLLLGILTRWAAAGLAIIMLGAIYYVHFVYHMGFVMPTGPGWNFPLTLLGGCIVLIAFGAGRWAIDRGQRRM
jgi:putative oxidoreductase